MKSILWISALIFFAGWIIGYLIETSVGFFTNLLLVFAAASVAINLFLILIGKSIRPKI